jgi:hypothetical protein
VWIALAASLLAGCSGPVVLRQANTYINTPRIASNISGDTLALWQESSHDPSTGGALFARMLTRGSGWGPVMRVSDGSGYLQAVPAIAVGADGTAVAAWRQVVEAPAFQSQVVVRKFVRASGWGPLQVLSANGGSPTLAIAPDGRVHIVFYQYPSFVARTLAPGEETWSPPFVLGDANFTAPAALVAGAGFAYAAFTGFDTVQLAAYSTERWQRALTISKGGRLDGEPRLAENSGNVVLSWSELAGAGNSGSEFLRRLSAPASEFALPRTRCEVAALADASIIAACPVQGPEVQGCFEPARGGPRQAYYSSIETYRRPADSDWLPVEVISDPRRRAAQLEILTAGGNLAFAVWVADVPCQAGSREFTTRFWPLQEAWSPFTILGRGSAFLESAALGGGTLRVLLNAVDDAPDRTPRVISLLTASEAVAGPAGRGY